MQSVKRLVSGNKARFRDPDLALELDLVYLTDSPIVILMGFPARSLAALYRNDRADVLAFLEARHGHKYRIYNFVPLSENSYDADYFGGRVSRYPFPDHHAPPLSLISLFVTDIAAWLEQDPENAAAIHCKAGKGRTGTMAISYLLSLPYLPQGPSPINNLIRMSKKKSRSKLATSASTTTTTTQSSTSLASNANGPSPASSTSTSTPPPPKIALQTSAAALQNGSTEAGTAESPLPMTPSSQRSFNGGGGGGGGGGPPDPEYLFALHTRQRMKPKFSDKSDWIPRALERASASRSGSLHSTPTSSRRASVGGAGAGAGATNGSGVPSSPLAQAHDAKDLREGGEQGEDQPGLTLDGFDAVVQATASAASAGQAPRAGANVANAAEKETNDSAEAEEEGEAQAEAEGGAVSTAAPPRKYGVSIASQRRFVGYWYRILHGRDARAPLERLPPGRSWAGETATIWGAGADWVRGQRKARLVEVVVLREQSAKPSASSRFIDDHIRVHLSRYDAALVRRLEEEEWAVRTGPDALFPCPHHRETAPAPDDEEKAEARKKEREEAVRRAREFAWGEAGSEGKFRTFATLKRGSSSAAPPAQGPAEDDPLRNTPSTNKDKDTDKDTCTRALRLVPHKIEGEPANTSAAALGLELDPDRELLLTVFVSKAHARLPHVASLASVWVVPSFEDVEEEQTEAAAAGRRKVVRMRFGAEDLDWRKGVSGIVGLEVVWEVEAAAATTTTTTQA